MDNNPTFVLLHGAGTGAWIWSRLQGELSLPSVALDVPGRNTDATPDTVVREIVDELDRRGTEAVYLVLHSLAGVLASGFAATLGARLRGIVYLSAVVPPEGRSFVDVQAFVNRLTLRLLFRFNPRGLKPSEAMIRRELCHDLSESDAELVVSRYEAEYPGLYLTPVGPPPPKALRSEYIKLLKDRSVPPARQDSIIESLPDVTVRELDAGHLAMLSNPKALAAALNAFARR